MVEHVTHTAQIRHANRTAARKSEGNRLLGTDRIIILKMDKIDFKEIGLASSGSGQGHIKLLVLELFFLILAHTVYKM